MSQSQSDRALSENIHVGEILEMKADPSFDRILAIMVCQVILNTFFTLQLIWLIGQR